MVGETFRVPGNCRADDGHTSLEDLPGAPVLTMNHLRLRAMDQVMFQRRSISLHEFIRLNYNIGLRMPWLNPDFHPK